LLKKFYLQQYPDQFGWEESSSCHLFASVTTIVNCRLSESVILLDVPSKRMHTAILSMCSVADHLLTYCCCLCLETILPNFSRHNDGGVLLRIVYACSAQLSWSLRQILSAAGWWIRFEKWLYQSEDDLSLSVPVPTYLQLRAIVASRFCRQCVKEVPIIEDCLYQCIIRLCLPMNFYRHERRDVF